MVNAVAITVWGWLERLGGIGLILLGLADNSPVPLPGSMDALTIILSAHHRDWWWYYAIMATVGAVLGGYMTYALARKSGRKACKRNCRRRKPEKSIRHLRNMASGVSSCPHCCPRQCPFFRF